MAESKIYIIPLRKEFQKASYKRKTNKAVRALKAYVEKHTKCDRVVIGEELNEHLWSRGITNPPAKVKVEITVDVVTKDDVEVKEAFVNLIGFKKKVVEQTKKGILSKDNAGLKGKLQDAVSTLKGDSKDSSVEDSEEVKSDDKVKVKVAKKKKVVIKDNVAETKTESKEEVKETSKTKESKKE